MCFVGWLLTGAKRWFIWGERDATPPFAIDPILTPAQWLRDVHPTLSTAQRQQLLACTVGPGEAIYVPDALYHQTLNIETTVFYTMGALGGAAPTAASEAWQAATEAVAESQDFDTYVRRLAAIPFPSKSSAAETCSRFNQRMPNEVLIQLCQRAVAQ
jgi:hypothetical protein